MSVSSPDAQYVRELVHQRAAIVLDDTKLYLITARLAPLATVHGFGTIAELVSAARGGRSLQDEVVEALTTNETSFFRDAAPFEALRRVVLPPLLAARATTRTLTIWSAACSTGQEPYSIAMLLLEHFPELSSWNIRIIGTDLSTAALAKAKSATFRQLELNRGLPAAFLVKYMERRGAEWQVKPDVRRRVELAPLNLIGPWPLSLRPDIVFLRNVLIYFDRETKATLLARVRSVMPLDGVLFLGAAESPLQLDDAWGREPFGTTSFYRRRA